MDKPLINKQQNEYIFSEDEIENFVKTKQDFLDGKTTARSLEEVKNDLKERYGKQ